MVTALEAARAAVGAAAERVNYYQTLLAERRTAYDAELTTLRIAHDAAREEANTFRQDALRWRDRHYQDTLHKRQMSVGLLRKATDELRTLLSGVPNDAA
jgi:hypothetical protein